MRGQFLNHHLTDLSLASRAGEESEVDEQGVGEWKPGQVRQELSGLERSLSITTNTWASTWSSKPHPTHLLAPPPPTLHTVGHKGNTHQSTHLPLVHLSAMR